jgi:hypothetical protein
VFGHNDVACHEKSVVLACLFKGAFECATGGWSVEFGIASVTAESNKVKLSSMLVALQSPGHVGILVWSFGDCL